VDGEEGRDSVDAAVDAGGLGVAGLEVVVQLGEVPRSAGGTSLVVRAALVDADSLAGQSPEHPQIVADGDDFRGDGVAADAAVEVLAPDNGVGRRWGVWVEGFRELDPRFPLGLGAEAAGVDAGAVIDCARWAETGERENRERLLGAHLRLTRTLARRSEGHDLGIGPKSKGERGVGGGTDGHSCC
jgi:hypothetical protein